MGTQYKNSICIVILSWSILNNWCKIQILVTLGYKQWLPITKEVMTFLGPNFSLLHSHLSTHLLILLKTHPLSHYTHFFFNSSFKKTTSGFSSCFFHAISRLTNMTAEIMQNVANKRLKRFNIKAKSEQSEQKAKSQVVWAGWAGRQESSVSSKTRNRHHSWNTAPN